MRLSDNFTLAEFLKTSTGIKLQPQQKTINNIKTLCRNILQPAREHIGHPLKITSGYRNRALNRLIKGSSTSQHLKGEAADFIIPAINKTASQALLINTFYWIAEHCQFNQLILYMGAAQDDLTYKWVHVATGPKKEVLVAFNGRYYNIENKLI